MQLSQYAVALAAIVGAGVEAQRCTANKVLDNFSQFANRQNSLGAVMGDDKSMTSFSASGSTLTMNPKAGSYFYENFPCENVQGNGYSGLTFSATGPAQASYLLEIQTRASCTAASYTSTFRNVTVGTAATTVTVPFSDFVTNNPDTNLGAVTSFVWSTFTKTGSAYTVSNIQFVCQR